MCSIAVLKPETCSDLAPECETNLVSGKLNKTPSGKPSDCVLGIETRVARLPEPVWAPVQWAAAQSAKAIELIRGQRLRASHLAATQLLPAPRCDGWKDVRSFAPGLRPPKLRLSLVLALVEAQPVLEDEGPAGRVGAGFGVCGHVKP
jgi:hypothetical protein